MKPKTKFQKEVSKIHLPAIKAQQRKEMIAVFKHIAIRTITKGTTCMECGHTFDIGNNNHLLVHSIEKECKCPKCKTKLEIKDTRKRKFFTNHLFSIHSIVKGMQVLRYYEITRDYVYGQSANYEFVEVGRCFIAPDGRNAAFGKLSATNYFSKTYFVLHSPFTLRSNHKAYEIDCETWSGSKLIPEIYRNGFSGDLKRYSEISLFKTLLGSNIMETFWKTGQDEMFERFYGRDQELKRIWPQIKLCNKNKYKITDWYMWEDYIKLLKFFKKDITNAYYVCPKDLRKQHDIYVARKRKYDKEMDIKKRLKKLEDDERNFIKQKSKYFDMKFSDGEIVIVPLKSVKEYFDMGEIMHHCVYTNSYYSKSDTLVLSAYIDDKPIETVEILLKDNSLLQSRGKLNNDTEYHDRIISLVEQNKKVFKQRKRQKQTA